MHNQYHAGALNEGVYRPSNSDFQGSEFIRRLYFCCAQRRTTTYRAISGFILAITIIFLPVAGQGAVKIWDGSYQGGNWGAWQNWSDNSVPVDGDDLIFPASPIGHFINTNDIVGLEVRSITFLAGGYTLNGNSVTITTSDGINGNHSGGTCVVNIGLALQTDTEASCANAGAILRLDGSVHLDGHNLTCNAINAASDIQVGGSISGVGKVIKEGPGHALFDALLSNTYTGTTRVNDGTLELNDIAAAPVTMIPGDIVMSNENELTTATLLLTEGNQIADTASIYQYGFCDFILDDVNETIANLSLFYYGDVSTGTGTLTLGNNATLALRGMDFVIYTIPTISGNLNVGTGTCTVYATGSSSIPAVVSGTADIVKSGYGNMRLESANTFTGTLTLMNGFTTISDSSALGTSDGGTIIEATAYLDLVNNVHVIGEDLSLNNSNNGLRSFSGTNTWSGTVTLLQDAEIFTRDGSHLTIDGPIGGAGALTKYGPGILTLSGSGNSYAGGTAVTDGILELGAANVIRYGTLTVGDNDGPKESVIARFSSAYPIHSDAYIVVNCDGLLDFNNYTDDLGYVLLDRGKISTGTGTYRMLDDINVIATTTSNWIPQVSGYVDLNTPGQRVFHINGTYLDLSAPTEGAGGITKTGGGVLVLGWPNTYDGVTDVQQGYLELWHAGSLGSTNGGTVVRSGATMFYGKSLTIADEALELNGNGVGNYGALYCPNDSDWNGPIGLATDTRIRVNSGCRLDIGGSISGAGALEKTYEGTLAFNGSSANTYSGDTLVTAGILELNKSVWDGAIPGPGDLYVGDGASAPDSMMVQWLANNQVDEDVTINVIPGGTVDLNGSSDLVGNLVLDSGDVTTGSGTMSLAGNVTATRHPGGEFPAISGNLNLGSATRTFNVTITTNIIPAFYVDAQVSGTGGILKTGWGSLHLTSSNSYSGITTVEQGLLGVSDDDALGDTAAGTVVQADAILQLYSANIGNESLSLAGAVGRTTLYSHITDNSWAGDITLQSDVSMTIWSNATLTLSGVIDGPGGITMKEGGALALSGATANTYAGDTHIVDGTLILNKTVSDGAIPGNLEISGTVKLAHNHQIANTSDVLVNSGGLLDFDVYYDYLDTLRGSGSVNFGSGGWIYLGYNNGSSTFDGSFTGIGYAPGWTVGKTGSGTFTMNGDNSFSAGRIQVNNGTVVANGIQPQAPVLINGAASALGGIGTVGHVTCNGSLQPGTSPGILTCSNLTFTASGDYYVELNGPVPGIGYDQMDVHGSNVLAGSTLHVTPAFTTPVVPGDEFVIINNDGAEPVYGYFNGLTNNAEFSAGGFRFRITYGNDVTLTLVDVPASEAGAWITGGNGNYTIDRDECNELMVALSNDSGTPMTGISAHLASVTHNVMVTQPESVYPDIIGGGSQLNITPFQLSTLSGFIAGSDIELDLVVETSTHGTFIVPVTLPSGVPSTTPVRYDISTPLAIPDVGTAESTNTVGGFLGPVTKVAVSLWLTHPYSGDLTIELIAPDGTTVKLSDMNGGAGANYGTGSADVDRTVFDDDAGTLISTGMAPFVGTYKPEEGLYSLLDSTANGSWRLRVTDSFGGTLGTLRTWSLFLYPMDDTSGGGYCDTCMGEIQGRITTNDVLQTGRVRRWGHIEPPASCSRPLVAQTVFDSKLRYCDVYAFTNDSPDTACISVGLENTTNRMQSVAYLYSFDPSNVLSNYVGDARSSTEPALFSSPSVSYSFLVPPGAEFFVTVNEASTNLQGNAYTLLVSGLPCPEPVLNIEAVPTDAVCLDWPSWAGGYRLQQSPTLDPPVWSWSSEEPRFDGGRFVVTNVPMTTTRFYRLRKD